jgi:hypothetical protein
MPALWHGLTELAEVYTCHGRSPRPQPHAWPLGPWYTPRPDPTHDRPATAGARPSEGRRAALMARLTAWAREGRQVSPIHGTPRRRGRFHGDLHLDQCSQEQGEVL